MIRQGPELSREGRDVAEKCDVCVIGSGAGGAVAAAELAAGGRSVVLLEQGRYVPSLSLALKIARIFGVPVESVFELADDA